ncbi:MAG TPA: OmpH family outer membrane protein [Nitrospirae bacterium]|nr:periplasmic chaperone [bacterium BMS3Abin06]HDH13200.1 OmpH family outer membrane protein [Nitrospirota bacterium]HDZ01837.1 OmpH family outer membrane protein [Nitrospirota bacterium]
MKKIIFFIIISLLACSVQAAEVKIGYVDLRKIVMESDQGKEAIKTLDSIEKAKNAIIREKIREIKKLEEELTKQAAILTPETIEKKKAEHENLMEEYQKMRRDSEKDLQKNEAELIQKIVLDVKKLLAGLAQKEGYIAVLDKAGVIYMPDESDLTERVLKMFNEAGKPAEKTD